MEGHVKPKGYEQHYWAFCLSCKKAMWGMSLPKGLDSDNAPRQNMEYKCPHCGSINLFRNSSQPVEWRPVGVLERAPSKDNVNTPKRTIHHLGRKV